MKIAKAYLTLTKTGIILFALVSALAGYAVSFRFGQDFDPMHPILLLVGLYFVAGGGFALNQAQEWKIDSLMPRTKRRPIPSGVFSPFQGYAIGFLMCVFGLFTLLILGVWPASLALLTLVLYNGVYTYIWKRQWAFAAVPGAIPGAMPVVIGYSVNQPEIWRPDCVYLFLILFLWQMPHFWSLAIRFREDYRAGGIPVLPVRVGVDRSMYHIGLYVFTYVGVALLAPWFLRAHALYLLLVFPISVKLLWEFYKYFRSTEARGWLPFFLWTNLSLLVYLAVPVMDKWLYLAL
jgi:protoheme IX farnesyltransferase